MREKLSDVNDVNLPVLSVLCKCLLNKWRRKITSRNHAFRASVSVKTLHKRLTGQFARNDDATINRSVGSRIVSRGWPFSDHTPRRFAYILTMCAFKMSVRNTYVHSASSIIHGTRRGASDPATCARTRWRVSAFVCPNLIRTAASCDDKFPFLFR